MENRNVIEIVLHTALTKRELIELINEAFPDEEVATMDKLHSFLQQLCRMEQKCRMFVLARY